MHIVIIEVKNENMAGFKFSSKITLQFYNLEKWSPLHYNPHMYIVYSYSIQLHFGQIDTNSK